MLCSIAGVLIASSSSRIPCGAISSWGSDKVQFINCSLRDIKGGVVGFVRLGEVSAHEVDKNATGLFRFDSINIASYFQLHLNQVMQKVNKEKKPHLNYALCFHAMHQLEQNYNKEAQKCMSIQSIDAMQLAFFIGDTLSVIYACNNKDAKRLFPPIQLIEYFPDIMKVYAGIMVLSGDTIAKDDGKCEVITFPFKDKQSLSVIYPKKAYDLQFLVDSIVPQVFENGTRTFLGKSQSKALVVALHLLSNYDESLKNTDNTDENMCTIS